VSTIRLCPFLDSARKGRKEADLRGGFLQSRPLLKISPPKQAMPEEFDNKAEMSRFPPIRSLTRHISGRKSGHFLPEQELG